MWYNLTNNYFIEKGQKVNDILTVRKLKRFGLSGNELKILGAIFMVIDHVGFMFFPYLIALRIIGRLSYPIFAFMIAEGCYYTKNKVRYFLNLFALGSVCQLVYYLYDGQLYMSILITFSLSILVIYAMQFMKETLFSNKGLLIKSLSVLIFALSIVALYFLNIVLEIDYGFWGSLAPAFAIILRKPQNCTNKLWGKIDNHISRVFAFGVGLLFLALKLDSIQIYCLLSLPILLLYSGKRGKLKMKYFFYLFYPIHLLVLQGLIYVL